MALTATEMTTVGSGPWKWGGYAHANTKQTISALLWALRDAGGVVHDPTGFAPRKLVAAALKDGYHITPTHQSGGSLSQLLGEMEHGRYKGSIERETNSKRTYQIALLLNEDEMPPRPVLKSVQRPLTVQPVPTDGGTGPQPEPEPVPDDPTPAPHPGPGGEPRPEDPNVAPLAVAEPEPVEEVVEPTLPPLVLLSPEDDPVARLFAIQNDLVAATMAVAAMAAPVVQEVIDNADPEQAERLAKTLEENNRLRAKVNTLTETVRAKTAEAEAFRKQVMVLQNNLKAIQQASADAGNRERNLAKLNGNQRFISARPEPAIAARR